ncbi:P-loop containing nucleoside triphosphate hydrolase protein [Zopfochytrium polystomum]|nr:P-loop containing nucleoside triphosphate hydrolase protein [Zopfochytrium polystomum]
MEQRPGEERTPTKVAIVGDGASGKRSLLRAFVDSCPDSVRIDDSSATVHITTDGQTDTLELWTDDSYDRLRPLVLTISTVVLICFSTISPMSFEDVVERWMPEVDYYCPPRHVILVCCRKDLREDAETVAYLSQYHMTPITTFQGIKAAARIGAYRYVECSSLTGEGVKELLEHAARASRITLERGATQADRERERKRHRYRSRCIVL